MNLKDKETGIAYVCPECGGSVFGPKGFFSLTGDLFRLKCSCEDGSELLVTRKDGKDKISVPCIMCGENHTFTLDEGKEFSSLITLSCRVSGVGIGYIGNDENLKKGLKKTESTLRLAAEDSGFESVDVFLEAKKAAKKSGANVLTAEEITALNSVIAELTEEGEITCHCGSCTEPTLDITSECVKVSCPVCMASAEIPTVKIRNPYTLSEIMKIELI